ncbi:MAG: hypothetical protein Q4D48_08270 [Coriobacteriales bacterium]|nr:hypothetical protein [Coriobacteriales bacterium]
MGERGNEMLELRLERHFAARREVVSPGAIDDLTLAMVAEDAQMTRMASRDTGLISFVVAQVRFIPLWTWVAQALLVALMLFVAAASESAEATKLSVGLLSAMTVLVGMPTVHASKLHGMAELEYSCLHNAAGVLVARLIVLGCSSALAVALMVGVVASSLEMSAFTVALWACPPFFGSCAAALTVLRKASPDTAVPLTVSWVMGCCMALLAVAIVFPEMYGNTALSVWAVAASLALIWLMREVAMTIRSAAAGLDALYPQMAKTYH